MAISETNANQPPLAVAPWIADCIVICPVVTALLLIVGENAWWPIVTVASAVTIALFQTFDGVGMSPGHAAEAISFALSAVLAALAPSIAMALSEHRGIDRVASLGALLPVWLVVLAVPAWVVFRHSGGLESGLHPTHLAASFMLAFSAAATSVALAYTIWVRHNPDAVVRNRMLPKRRLRLATGSLKRSTLMADESAAA